jgi:hypothetical protein
MLISQNTLTVFNHSVRATETNKVPIPSFHLARGDNKKDFVNEDKPAKEHNAKASYCLSLQYFIVNLKSQ